MSQLLPIADPAAMKSVGLSVGGSVTALLRGFVANAANGQTTLTTINSRQAAIGIVKSPDQPPADFTTVDTPYCPCTTETVLIDAGHNNLLQVTATWLNSDATTARTSNDIIHSVSFHG